MTDCLVLVAAKYQDVTIPSTPDHIDCVETKCETTNYLLTCDHVQCNVLYSAVEQSICFTIGFHNHGEGPY